MFRELCKPAKGGMGWYMSTKEGNCGWLTTNGLITTSTMDLKILFFDSELEILEMACWYYHGDGEVYPYIDRLVELQRKSGAVHTPTIIGSKPMEFL